MSEPIFEMNHIEHYYGERRVLSIDHMIFEPGEVTGIIGPNGSGKSTLLRIMALLETPTKGVLKFSGKEVSPLDIIDRGSITLLQQDPYMLKRSVYENIAFGLRIRKKTEHMDYAVAQAMDWVGLSFEGFAHRNWRQLSGGEAHRVALASRLVFRPRVLLLDEPTSSLDIKSAHLIKDAVERARREWGTTVFVVSHDLLWLYDVSDRCLSLYEGRIVDTGTENLIFGPWSRLDGEIWRKYLADGQTINSASPPREDSVAALDPSNVIIASEKPSSISAQNIIRAVVAQMIFENGSGKVIIKASAGGVTLSSRVTLHAFRELSLHPGMTIWLIFKASSLHWL